MERKFQVWDSYWGELFDDGDRRFPTKLYGLENVSTQNEGRCEIRIPDIGACFGFISQGRVQLKAANLRWDLGAKQFFETPQGVVLTLGAQTRIVICQRVGYLGVSLAGGPIEPLGRLRYIDGCSDSVLIAPPVLGDPCQNLLHFPPGTDQTAHTHPSTRAGVVADGEGVCVAGGERVRLSPGRIFYIPAETVHKFQTPEHSTMAVVAYHPDSDCGPTHEAHPMINRTWVDGKPMDNTTGVHRRAKTIRGENDSNERRY